MKRMYIRINLNCKIFNYFFFILMLFLNIFYYSLAIITGKYPYTKRLNNGNYVIVSKTNITFADSTLSTVINSINLDVYDSQNEIGSTTIAQFSNIINGYVIVIAKLTMYIFSSNGVLFAEKNVSIYNSKYPSFVIPKMHLENNYYFVLIYGNNSLSNSEDNNDIIFQKVVFDSSSNEINLDNSIIFNPLGTSLFYPSISCQLMRNNSNEYIACAYGTYNILYVSVFDPNDNYTHISTISNNLGGQYFKSSVIPDEMERTLFCTFKPGETVNLKCLTYDIKENILILKEENICSGCGHQPWSLIIEYFYETNNFMIGCKGEDNKVYLSEYSKDLTLIKQQIMDDPFPSDYGNVGRINIVIPKGSTKYNLFVHPSKDCWSNCPIIEPVLLNVGEEINDISDYPILTINCNNNHYVNYDLNECFETIPDGYYCNNKVERTI